MTRVCVRRLHSVDLPVVFRTKTHDDDDDDDVDDDDDDDDELIYFSDRYNILLYTKNHLVYSREHTVSSQRHLNVKSTSWRCLNVDLTQPR